MLSISIPVWKQRAPKNELITKKNQRVRKGKSEAIETSGVFYTKNSSCLFATFCTNSRLCTLKTYTEIYAKLVHQRVKPKTVINFVSFVLHFFLKSKPIYVGPRCVSSCLLFVWICDDNAGTGTAALYHIRKCDGDLGYFSIERSCHTDRMGRTHIGWFLPRFPTDFFSVETSIAWAECCFPVGERAELLSRSSASSVSCFQMKSGGPDYKPWIPDIPEIRRGCGRRRQPGTRGCIRSHNLLKIKSYLAIVETSLMEALWQFLSTAGLCRQYVAEKITSSLLRTYSNIPSRFPAQKIFLTLFFLKKQTNKQNKKKHLKYLPPTTY